MQLLLTLHRNDLWFPMRKINRIYSLSRLSKLLGKQSAVQFYPLFKKALLCSNFEFWYSNYVVLFSFLLNFLFFNIFLKCFLMTNSEEMKMCIGHILLMNIPNMLSIVSFITLFFMKHSQTQREMLQYLNYFIPNILQLPNMHGQKENDTYSITFNNQFDFNITKDATRGSAKAISLYDKEEGNQYFEYAINIPNASFRIFHYEALLEKREKEIIREIMVYLQHQDMKSKRDRLHFFLMILIWIAMLYFQKESVTLVVTFAYFIVLILLYYIFQYKSINSNTTHLKKFIGDINKEIITEGYCIDMSENLVSLLAIRKNKIFSIEEAKKEVELIKMS